MAPNSGNPGFSCEIVDNNPESPCLRLKGVLDELGVEPMLRVIEELVRHPASKLTVELQDLSFMSSAGLTVFLNLHKRMQALKGQLVLANPRPAISRILKLTRLDKVITIIGADLSDSPAESSPKRS